MRVKTEDSAEYRATDMRYMAAGALLMALTLGACDPEPPEDAWEPLGDSTAAAVTDAATGLTPRPLR